MSAWTSDSRVVNGALEATSAGAESGGIRLLTRESTRKDDGEETDEDDGGAVIDGNGHRLGSSAATIWSYLRDAKKFSGNQKS